MRTRATNGHDLGILLMLCGLLFGYTSGWTPIVVKNIIQLGPQITPDVTQVSRDGGYSVLLNGQIIWLYDDTECLDRDGKQLSFVSNTAAYAKDANKNVSKLVDFGVKPAGKDKKTGRTNYAILADTTVATGGWIGFSEDELDFNDKRKGIERVAICKMYLSNREMHADGFEQGLEHHPLPTAPTKRFCSPLWCMSTISHKNLPRNTKPEA